MVESFLANWLPLILIVGGLVGLCNLAAKLFKRLDRALPDSDRK